MARNHTHTLSFIKTKLVSSEKPEERGTAAVAAPTTDEGFTLEKSQLLFERVG
jgi:hypothetical protein